MLPITPQWKVVPPRKPVGIEATISAGDHYLAVEDRLHDTPPHIVEYFSLSFALRDEAGDASLNRSLQRWPRQAIAMARAKLDELEASLPEVMERDTPTI